MTFLQHPQHTCANPVPALCHIPRQGIQGVQLSDGVTCTALTTAGWDKCPHFLAISLYYCAVLSHWEMTNDTSRAAQHPARAALSSYSPHSLPHLPYVLLYQVAQCFAVTLLKLLHEGRGCRSRVSPRSRPVWNAAFYFSQLPSLFSKEQKMNREKLCEILKWFLQKGDTSEMNTCV